MPREPIVHCDSRVDNLKFIFSIIGSASIIADNKGVFTVRLVTNRTSASLFNYKLRITTAKCNVLA